MYIGLPIVERIQNSDTRLQMSSMSTSSSSPNSKVHSPSSSPKVSVSLIFAFSGSSPYAFTAGGDGGVSTLWQGGGNEYMRTTSCLIGSVFYNHIRFVVLEVTEGEKDDVSLVDPDLIARATV